MIRNILRSRCSHLIKRRFDKNVREKRNKNEKDVYHFAKQLVTVWFFVQPVDRRGKKNNGREWTSQSNPFVFQAIALLLLGNPKSALDTLLATEIDVTCY